MKLLISLSLAISLWAVLLTAHPELADAFRRVADAPQQIEAVLAMNGRN